MNKPDKCFDMDELAPEERTMRILRGLEGLYVQFLGSWNLETGEYSPGLRQRVQYTVSWFRKNFDVAVLETLIRQDNMRLGDVLIYLLRG